MSTLRLERTEDQQAIVDLFANVFAKECTPERVRAVEPLGFDPVLWDRLGEVGLVGMALEVGLAELSLVAEEAGRVLAPCPVVETAVAARAMGALPEGIVTLALTTLSGVPFGAVADAVLTAGGLVVPAARHGVPWGAWATVEAATPGEGAEHDHGRAVDEWRTLSAAWLVGVAQAALDLGVAYVKERHQFGVPIGSFQAVQHGFANVATALDGARLLARRAAQAADESDPAAPVLASMAYLHAGRVAQQVTAASLHYHGGYGYALEYEIQRYLRHAKAASLALGDPHREELRLARLLVPFAFRLPQDGDPWRDEVRAFCDEHVTPEVWEEVERTGTVHHWGLHKAMADKGWLGAGWPVEWGGQDRDPFQQAVLSDELSRAHAPVDGWGTADAVAHIVRLIGTDEQRARIIPAYLRGELLMCLGYSEPEAGSDVASVATKARRDGEQWVIDGQKMFTTLAQEAGYVLLLTRTNPEVAKHRGLTMFLVPMETPGITMDAIHTLGGERTNATWYTDVRVGDDCRIGEVDGGWGAMMVALAYERQPAAWGEMARLLDRTVAWAATQPGLLDDPMVLPRLARVAIDCEVGRLAKERLAWEGSHGHPSHVSGSMAKLFCSEAFARAAADLLDLCGTAGLGEVGTLPGDLIHDIDHAWRHAQVMTIYAGSSEVQRGIIAERGLGLPRRR